MPSIEQFLYPLDIMDAAAESSLSPDFLVLMMLPALLHFSTIGRFSATMLKLLEQRLSVYMKLSALQDHANRNTDGFLPASKENSSVDFPGAIKAGEFIVENPR